jgi:hypothetical protein
MSDLPGIDLLIAHRPRPTPIPEPEFKYYRSSYIVATLANGTVSLVGRLEFDLPSQAAEAALERGKRFNLPVRKLGRVNPNTIHGDDCIVVFERTVMNGMTEVYDG